MKIILQSMGLSAALMLSACSSNSQQNTDNENSMKNKQSIKEIPAAKDFVASPLRNRIRVELNASLEDVWQLVGDPGKMPEYSAGVQSVETKLDQWGNCKEYLCHFKPMKPGETGIDHRAIMKWYEPLQGWASIDEEPNPFGLTESLSLLTFNEDNGKTLFQWDVHFNADDIDLNKNGFEQALSDISKRLTDRFGGRVIENSVEGKNP